MSRNEIGPETKAVIGVIRIRSPERIIFNVNRTAPLVLLNGRHFPASDQFADRPSTMQEGFAGANRKLISVTDRQHLRNIGTGNGTLRPVIVIVLEERTRIDRILGARACSRIGIYIPNRLLKGIRDQESETI